MTFAKLRHAVFLLVVGSVPVFAQTASGTANRPTATATDTADLPEISTQEQTPSFQIKVNLVEIRAVVRDGVPGSAPLSE